MEIIAALIGAAAVMGAAWITILPSMRRTRGAVEADGTATREAVTALATQLADVKDEVRADVYELRAHVVDVRAWQAGHDAEHLLFSRHERGGDAS